MKDQRKKDDGLSKRIMIQNSLKKIILSFIFILVLITIQSEEIDEYEGFFRDSVKQLLRNTPTSAMIGIIYISESDINTAFNIQDDLIHTITELGYCVISKDWFEHIPYLEENFGIRYSFNKALNEDAVVTIGHFIRADIALIGRVIDSDNARKLNLRTIDMKTEQVVGTITCDL